MIVYVGMTEDKRMVRQLREAGIGRIQQRGLLRLTAMWEGERWAFDNGAFMDWRNEREFDGDQYLTDCAKVIASGKTPCMAVAPDFVGGGRDSLEFSHHWRARIDLEFTNHWPWFLVLQDGMQPADLRWHLRVAFPRWWSGLFLGGTDKFKGEAQQWCDFAHDNGLLFHYGRAGTKRKIEHAREVGADSLDSSWPLWTRDRFKTFLKLVGAHAPQQRIAWEVST